MKTTVKTIVIILFTVSTAFGQKVEEQSYQAYLRANPDAWLIPVKTAKMQFESGGSDADLFEYAMARYGLLSATMRDRDEDMFDEYVDETIEHFEKLIENDHRKAESQAVLSSIYGLKIAYTPWKGMFWGPKSGKYIEEAIESGRELPIVLKMYGNYLYYTPEQWGGDKNEAVGYYSMAINKFEENRKTGHWLYLDAMIWLGHAYRDIDQNMQAESVWRQALKKEPDFKYAEYLLSSN
ncbi:MAG TPA: hypothetical protein DDY13_18865 [Cytophagales bacterium]|jgi:tetratricopeptide (TPR) repeat protein|nr:hypothetical protein [Cytophagales bacterium]